MKVPQPPSYTADKLLREIRRRGGRVYRMREIVVFCLTNDEEVAAWLLDLGGHPFAPRSFRLTETKVPGAYLRAPEGPLEWDIFIHTIPVLGEKTIHQAAGPITLVKHMEPREAAA
jgi:hypothetical protein